MNYLNLLHKAGSAGIPKLEKEAAIAAFIANLEALEPFSKGEAVEIAELKYGRKTKVLLGMIQKITVKGAIHPESAKLVGLAMAAASADANYTYKGEETGNIEIPVRNFTGIWKPEKGTTFSDGKSERPFSIFNGKF